MSLISAFEEALPAPREIEDFFDRLWPICRSITGKGFRSSLEILREIVPFNVEETPSGTAVFDWKVPLEWNIDDAYLADESGAKVIDFMNSNLHVLNYSVPVDKKLTLEELAPHLYSRPEQPDAIPYLTSYYKEHWGFCMTHKQREKLKPGTYHAVIRSSLKPGSLTTADCILKSTTGSSKEVLISSYLCHPSMANNELSGPLVQAFLYRALSKLPVRRHNYRFILVPETIGAITYLSKHGESVKRNCTGGMVLTCVGDGKKISYKKSRRGDSLFDQVAAHELALHAASKNSAFTLRNFDPLGSDERQYCSPGFNLPVGSFTRSPPGDFPEYHTSLDDKRVISFEAMRESVLLCLKVLLAFENAVKFENKIAYCEPMLGKRGLYSTLGSQKKIDGFVHKAMWMMAYSDTQSSLLDIARNSQSSICDLADVAAVLVEHDLLKEIS